MRAMVIPRFGGPEVFELRDIERPSPGPGDVLVRVIASGTNPVDAKIRQTGYWADLALPAVLGYEAAGVVEETGAGVTAFRRGDEVYFAPEIHGNARGTYAEYSVAPASQIGLKPRNLSFEEAAAIPLAGGTAWEAVVRRLRLAPGETILIHGGAGGVGSLAVQFARAAGARVIATASQANLGTLRDLGADVALDYGADDVTKRTLDETEGRGADAAFEVQGGGDLVSRCLAAVRPFARIACILPPAGNLRPLYTKNITLYGVFLTREGPRLEEMRRFFERGQARVLIDRVLPLEAVAEAHRRLDSHHGRGKIVLRVAGEPAT